MFYLVCYDIVNDRRRTKVSNFLQGYGLRVQKSVFECVLSPDQYKTVQKRVQKLIKAQEDQIRFYPMSPRHRQLVKIVGMQPDFQVDDVAFIV
ncbi:MULTISPECIES: CRISPR-associated endonuclease Cas2 [Pseudanabaena]|uniref:CRISPR-associated endonuclease Cas2 n=1 Tax=Pseudanabaena TaxID=1152 RepID=UPI00247ADBEC|nr:MULTISPECIES: CRISPR-associated endonuclease Cas2 [Pseudanabaena]MEA5489633.1 CRISPR-associated endonuclease Cas2 [Pseudanabaena sp. CCNP1317]WGS75266.1 CRISPR-associated endonuclease Cas2 [Pseudanabaena galeata CCNP1313]